MFILMKINLAKVFQLQHQHQKGTLPHVAHVGTIASSRQTVLPVLLNAVHTVVVVVVVKVTVLNICVDR